MNNIKMAKNVQKFGNEMDTEEKLKKTDGQLGICYIC